MTKPCEWIAVAAATVVAVQAGTGRTADYDFEPPKPGTYTLPVIKAAADGALLDSAGKPVRLAELTHGRITVMSIIENRGAAGTPCSDATEVLRQLHRRSAGDAALARQLRLVSLSFDPTNEAPERMAGQSQVPAAPWHFVTARSPAELKGIGDAYDQAVDPKQNPPGSTGLLRHRFRVFLIDAAGKIRNIYNSGALDWRLILADVRTLLLESAPSASTPGLPRPSDHPAVGK